MIIGISGKSQHGKDTVGKIIQCKNHGLSVKETEEYLRHNKNINSSYEIKKFAHKLKERLSVTWNVPIDKFEYEDFKQSMSPLGISWRKLLQLEGEAARNIDADYWIKALFCVHNECLNLIITDLRYLNELEYIRNKNGILIRVENTNIISKDSHLSENELDLYEEWDYKIINNKSISDLVELIYKINI